MERSDYEWHDEPPKENGDFFYNGPTPDNSEQVLAIVQITTHPDTAKRIASLMLPPGWRGNKARRMSTVHFGTVDEWKGQWSGPEYGLCCMVV